MSGNSPDWLLKDHYVLYMGKPAVVKDYGWISAPGPNNDELVVSLKGITGAVDMMDIEPLPVEKSKLSVHLSPGAVVCRENGQMEFVSRTWLKKNARSDEEEIMVKFDDNPFSREAHRVHPVPPGMQKQAAEMVEKRLAAEQKKKAEREKWASVERAFENNKKKNRFGF